MDFQLKREKERKMYPMDRQLLLLGRNVFLLGCQLLILGPQIFLLGRQLLLLGHNICIKNSTCYERYTTNYIIHIKKNHLVCK